MRKRPRPSQFLEIDRPGFCTVLSALFQNIAFAFPSLQRGMPEMTTERVPSAGFDCVRFRSWILMGFGLPPTKTKDKKPRYVGRVTSAGLSKFERHRRAAIGQGTVRPSILSRKAETSFLLNPEGIAQKRIARRPPAGE